MLYEQNKNENTFAIPLLVGIIVVEPKILREEKKNAKTNVHRALLFPLLLSLIKLYAVPRSHFLLRYPSLERREKLSGDVKTFEKDKFNRAPFDLGDTKEK